MMFSVLPELKALLPANSEATYERRSKVANEGTNTQKSKKFNAEILRTKHQ